MSGGNTGVLTLKKAYMRDLGYPSDDTMPECVDINDSSMPCFQSRDTQGYNGGFVWFEIEMLPDTLKDVYTTNHIESLSPYQWEAYWNVFMPLFLEEIKNDLCESVARTEEWQDHAILRSVGCR